MISLKDVTKSYGSTLAVNHVSATIEEDKIYCLLGCNGAGKTTLMKLIAGHIKADQGRIEVEGAPVNPAATVSNVSFIESRAVQFNTTLRRLIQMAASLDAQFDPVYAEKMLKKFRMKSDMKYGRLSFGMQTAFNSLLSLASSRKIILFDEPLLGLDAIMRHRFYSILNESYEQNPRTIIISTHMIDEMVQCAEELILMDKGNIIFRSTVNDIDEKAYSITGITKAVNSAIEQLNVIGTKVVGGYTTAYIFDDPEKLPTEFKSQKLGLQEFFIRMVGGDIDEE